MKSGCAGIVLCLIWSLSACQEYEPVSPDRFPERESKGFAVLMSFCGHCHGAPLPSSRTAEQWPGIIKRMQQYRMKQGMAQLTVQQKNRLLEYLKKHAAES